MTGAAPVDAHNRLNSIELTLAEAGNLCISAWDSPSAYHQRSDGCILILPKVRQVTNSLSRHQSSQTVKASKLAEVRLKYSPVRERGFTGGPRYVGTGGSETVQCLESSAGVKGQCRE